MLSLNKIKHTRKFPSAQVPVFWGRKMRAIDKNWPQSMQEYTTRVARFLECVADINAEQLPVCQLVVVQELIEFIVILGFKESLQLA